jgi:hypothetical protein
LSFFKTLAYFTLFSSTLGAHKCLKDGGRVSLIVCVRDAA